MKKKKLFATLALAAICIATLPAATCAEAKKDIATALDASQTACVLAHAFLPSVPVIAEVCAIDGALVPLIEKYILEAVKSGLIAPTRGVAARYSASAPPPDHSGVFRIDGGK